MRILLDPAAPTEGATAAATAPEPAPAPAAAPGVTLTSEEYRAFLDARAQLAQVEADKKRAEDEREAARLDKLAADGRSKEALDALRKSKDDELAAERAGRKTLEDQILASGLSATVTAGVADTTFVSLSAAAQVRDLLSSRLESVRDASGAVVVREKGTHKAAADAVKAWLASDEAAHFLRAGTSGGAGARGGNVPAPAAQEKPQTASDLLLQYERERLDAAKAAGTSRGLARN